MNCYRALIGVVTKGLAVAVLVGAGCSHQYDVSMDHEHRAAMSAMKKATADAREAAREARQSARSRPRTSTGTARTGGYYEPRITNDQTARMVAFPTGDPATSALLVHQVMPRVVRKGSDYNYAYHLTNLTGSTLEDVELVASNFENISVASARPAGERDDSGYRWNIGNIEPGKTQVIEVSGSSSDTGSASACLSATFSKSLCSGLVVVEPGLEIRKTATRDALICDPVDIQFTVSNPGTGIARNVRIVDDLPEGMTVDGRRQVNLEVGDLAPGASKQMSVKAKASRTGNFENDAVAMADGNLKASSNSVATVIRQPKLAISAECPEQRYLGRPSTCTYTIKNTGNGVCANTMVEAVVPAGAELTGVTPTQGGRSSGNKMVWNLGTLAAGQTRQVSLTSKATAATTLRSSASAGCACASTVTDSCETRVIGIPAILLEVVDVQDPIEVGSNTTYVITVTNQGTAPGTNIAIDCEIPEQSAYVSSTGTTQGTRRGAMLNFAPLGSLAPKQKAEWKIVVRASEPGDVRFSVKMRSDQLTSPVQETEATNQYR